MCLLSMCLASLPGCQGAKGEGVEAWVGHGSAPFLMRLQCRKQWPFMLKLGPQVGQRSKNNHSDTKENRHSDYIARER